MKKYLFKFKLEFFISILFIVLYSVLNIMLAYVLKYLLDAAEKKNLEQFKIIMIFVILYLLLLFTFSLLRKVFQANLIRKIMIDLKKDIFSRIINKNINNFSNEKSSQYISILINDLNILENDYFRNVLEMVSSIFSFLVASVLLVNLNIYIAIGVFITTIITIIVPQILNKKLRKSKLAYSEQLANFTLKIKDIFLGFEVIKCFNIENKISREYNVTNNNVEKVKFNLSVLNGLAGTVSYVLGMLMFFTALSLGTYFTIIGIITIGTMIAATQLMNNIANPIIAISSSVNVLKSVKLLEEKIDKILEIDNIEKINTPKLSFDSKVIFKNLTFAYCENNTILKNISMSIEKGKKYVIVGQSGCGKSTLMKLLVKYYEHYDGEILVDNICNKDINTEDLYKLISIIHQNVFLFDGTIKENINLFSDYNNDEFEEAIRLSGLVSSINEFQNGIETLVGENGSNLSGGQKQRIAIARAIIRKTPIIVLDEATASLDSETAYNIENSILNLKSLTAIVITHRLSKELLKKYDSIIAIKNGEIVEEGNFEKLISNKGYFYSLYNIQ